MLNFLEKNRASVLNTERPVYALNGKGFLVQCRLLVKMVPRLNNGIEMVALFSETFNTQNLERILVDEATGRIVGVTEQCYAKFGLHPNICYGHDNRLTPLNINQLLTDVLNVDDLKDGAVEFGDQTLDTSIVLHNNYVQKNALGKVGLPNDGFEAFKKYRVKLEFEVQMIFNRGPQVIGISFSQYIATSNQTPTFRSVSDSTLIL